MNAVRRCPVCRMWLPVDSPRGLCPRCLLQLALSPDSTEDDRPVQDTDAPDSFDDLRDSENG